MKPNHLAALLAAASLAGCSGSDGGPTVPATSPAASTAASEPITAAPEAIEAMPRTTPTVTPAPLASLNLVPFADPWSRAQPRWRDIDNNLYAPAFRSGATAFSYGRAIVTLTYERDPRTPYFAGRIEARGLKPNFAYQLKLAGKPIYGSRGFGATGSLVNVTSRDAAARPFLGVRRDASGRALPVNADDWTNQQLGFAGRWWDDTLPPGTNLDDAYYRTYYPRHTVYGYIFMGDFVTDEFGRANVPIASSHSYHITWQDKQNGIEDALYGDFPVRSTTPFYGYGRAIPATRARLWYEYEASRPNNVVLRAGTYHCRLLVTEEAFHTAGGEGGGVWQTVLASEEFRDTNPSNDIVFTIR